MAKPPEWVWKLPDGQQVRATFDPSTRIESVWLGNRIVSRSTREGKPGGHVVQLGPGASTGPYRAAAEARVVFDVFGKKIASCALTIDGVAVPPAQQPRPIRAFALPALSTSIAFYIAFRVAVRVGTIVGTRHETPLPPVPYSDESTSFAMGPITEIPASPATSVSTAPYRFSPFLAAIDRPVQDCLDEARKKTPKLTGRLVVEAKLGPDGRVVETAIVEHGGFPPAVEQCVATAVKRGRYALGPSSTLRFPVEYVDHPSSLP